LGGVIGREPELAVLQRFLDSIPSGPSALLLSGDPGIGKTTVWKEGLADALPRNYRILSCGPIEAETRLSYTALGDLLEPILEEALPSLPEPQRRALEIALLRSPSSGARADQRWPTPCSSASTRWRLISSGSTASWASVPARSWLPGSRPRRLDREASRTGHGLDRYGFRGFLGSVLPLASGQEIAPERREGS
jgi:hypothetical protein